MRVALDAESTAQIRRITSSRLAFSRRRPRAPARHHRESPDPPRLRPLASQRSARQRFRRSARIEARRPRTHPPRPQANSTPSGRTEGFPSAGDAPLEIRSDLVRRREEASHCGRVRPNRGRRTLHGLGMHCPSESRAPLHPPPPGGCTHDVDCIGGGRARSIARNGGVSSDHPIWSDRPYAVFLHTPDDVRRVVKYIDDNPGKHRLPPQSWPFVKPYDGWPFHHKRGP